MQGPRHTLVLLAAWSCAWLASLDCRADPVPPALEKWIDAEIAGASALETYPLLKASFTRLTYASENFPPMSAAEVVELEARVAGKPDHPDRTRLDVGKRRLGGPDESRHIAFWRAPDEWRLCETLLYMKIDYPALPLGPITDTRGAQQWTKPRQGVVVYFDATRRHDKWWTLNPSELSHTTPEAGYPLNYDPLPLWRGAYAALANHLTGGLAAPHARGAGATWSRHSPITLAGTRWSVEVGDDVVRARVTGRWDAGAGRGFTQELVILKSWKGLFNGRRSTAEGWTERAVGPRSVWVADVWKECLPSGQVNEETRLTELADLSDAAFQEATRLPDPNIPDTVRGTLTVDEIHDYTVAEVRTSRDLRWGGTTTVEDVGPGSTASATLRTVGWITLGTLVAGLVALRYRASRRA